MKAFMFTWIYGLWFEYKAVVYAADEAKARSLLADRMFKEDINRQVADRADREPSNTEWLFGAAHATVPRVTYWFEYNSKELRDLWANDREEYHNRVKLKIRSNQVTIT